MVRGWIISPILNQIDIYIKCFMVTESQINTIHSGIKLHNVLIIVNRYTDNVRYTVVYNNLINIMCLG